MLINVKVRERLDFAAHSTVQQAMAERRGTVSGQQRPNACCSRESGTEARHLIVCVMVEARAFESSALGGDDRRSGANTTLTLAVSARTAVASR